MSLNIVKNGQLQEVATHVSISADANNAIKQGTDGGIFVDSTSSVDIVTSWNATTSDDKVPSEKLVKTSLDDKADSSDLDDKADSTLVNNAIGTSDAYSSTKAYTVGEYCINDDKVWECILAHTGEVPSATSTYWREISLTSLNSNLKYKSGDVINIGLANYAATTTSGGANGFFSVLLPKSLEDITTATITGTVYILNNGTTLTSTSTTLRNIDKDTNSLTFTYNLSSNIGASKSLTAQLYNVKIALS